MPIIPIMSVMPINLAKVQTLAKCVAQKRHTGVFRRISGGTLKVSGGEVKGLKI